MISYTMALYTIPWHYIPWHCILYHGIISYIYHGIIYYTMALYTIPWYYIPYCFPTFHALFNCKKECIYTKQHIPLITQQFIVHDTAADCLYNMHVYKIPEILFPNAVAMVFQAFSFFSSTFWSDMLRMNTMYVALHRIHRQCELITFDCTLRYVVSVNPP